MTSLQSLAQELALTIASSEVWLSIALALLLGGLCLVVGICVTRTVGLLEGTPRPGRRSVSGSAPASWSWQLGGRRSGQAGVARSPRWRSVSLSRSGWPLARRARRPPRRRRDLEHQVTDGARQRVGGRASEAHGAPHRDLGRRRLHRRDRACCTGRPWRRVRATASQPVEFVDEAFYAVLGRDLATTGTETNLSALRLLRARGPADADLVPLGRAVARRRPSITLFGTAPLAARYFVVLPVAAARRGRPDRHARPSHDAGRRRGEPTLFGFLACLFLAPVPLIPGPFFSSWAVGHDLRHHAVWPGRGRGSACPVQRRRCSIVARLRWALACFVASADRIHRSGPHRRSRCWRSSGSRASGR